MQGSSGIHHVTAIAGDPQANVDFYAGLLGLRLVKRTVNFDDPGTYHLYYGDRTGTPGSLLTFFPWRGARRGKAGAGQVNAVAFEAPLGSLGWWTERLVSHGRPFDGPMRRFGEPVLVFADPDGMTVEIAFTAWAASVAGRDGGPASAEHALRRVRGVTIWEATDAGTRDMLTGPLGFTATAIDGATTRFSPQAGDGTAIDVRLVPGAPRAADGTGTVHHVAVRAADRGHQDALADALRGLDLRVTPRLDRQYFDSVYLREPGGVLFEIATDGPGFLVDEDEPALGTSLRLPLQYEAMRDDLERTLPSLRLPAASAGVA